MPYRRRKDPISIDKVVIKGFDVTMEPPEGLDIERFYLERMMEVVGIPELTVATAPELHRRILIMTYGPTKPVLDLPAVIGKYLGTTVNVNLMTRAEFNRKARKHVWAMMENYVGHHTRDIIYTEE